MGVEMIKKVVSLLVVLSFVFLSNVYPAQFKPIDMLRPSVLFTGRETEVVKRTEQAGYSPILILNCGSSSVKYQVIDMNTEEPLTDSITIDIGKKTNKEEMADAYRKAINSILDGLTVKPVAIGHRVVHGGEKFSASVLINEDVIKEIAACNKLAPLHNPYNLLGIETCMENETLKDLPMVAVFDTAFHQTMPEQAFIYAIPKVLYEKSGIRRYGFHGSSHRYVSMEADKMLRKDGRLKKNITGISKIITIHLGNGCSIAAVKGGKSIETSMGFTPLEGLVMGTRSGDVDPALMAYLQSENKMTAEEVADILNNKSGLLGISGISSDMRTLLEAERKGNKNAKLAIDIFIYRILKYTYSYAGILGGIDAIVLTGGIGEAKSEISQRIKSRLRSYFNANYKTEKQPSILTIKTNEQLIIARDTFEIYKSLRDDLSGKVGQGDSAKVSL